MFFCCVARSSIWPVVSMADVSLPVSLHTDLTHHFVWLDYCVFGGMLAVSTMIGLYYGCRVCRPGRREEGDDSPGEFLTANGKLGTVPVALSMLARYRARPTLLIMHCFWYTVVKFHYDHIFRYGV